jgi:4-amino-4-deoxy-L-arabinose transferase-like glycosyltransferase
MTTISARGHFVIVAVLSALVFIAPIREGDLAGYDDASFAYMAKDLLRGTNWVKIRVEHPPLVPLMQAGLFSVFGFSDFFAKLPSALAGLGSVLLVYWLTRRLWGDWHAVVAMLILAATAYFVKYAARAMTDVPFTFFFLAAICAWVLAEDNPRWYLAAGAFTGLAEMTRGLMWVGLLIIFVTHTLISRRRLARLHMAAGVALVLLPIAGWYAYLISSYRTDFLAGHMSWLDQQVYGALTPAWRRYTGLFEYALMLMKSYWPWLPFMVLGLVTVTRQRDRRGYLLTIWIAVVAILCAAARSRILRFMLPAYPAFSIFAAVGFFKLFTEAQIRKALAFVVPVVAVGVVIIAIHPPRNYHAREIRPIAIAATAATAANEKLAVYDSGQPRWDEASQLQWYGDRFAQVLISHEELNQWIQEHKTRVFVIDRQTYDDEFAGRLQHEVVADSGRLICVRLNGVQVGTP